MSSDPVLLQTQAWLTRAVIGLNLCPFAKAVHAKQQIRYVVSPATDADALLQQLCDEMQRLAASDPALVDTTLLIHPRVLADFLDFNDFLDVAEAALIAGLIQAPSAYAPTKYLDRAVARRAVVLDAMVEAGYLDEASARAVAASPVKIVDGFGHERTGAYFRQAVAAELVDRFGGDLVTRGGLRVFTTFDPAAQAARAPGMVGRPVRPGRAW